MDNIIDMNLHNKPQKTTELSIFYSYAWMQIDERADKTLKRKNVRSCNLIEIMLPARPIYT